MKSIIFVILSLFIINKPNNLVKSSCCSKSVQAECIVCGQSGCDCELGSEDDKTSLKKLLFHFIKKFSSKCREDHYTEGCNQHPQICPKKQGVAKVLTDILKKATCRVGKEEDSIREIIIKLLDPADCKRRPCQSHCDPLVQKVLKNILKTAAGCECKECPCECMMKPPKCDKDEYQYWFRTTQDNIRKEICGKPNPRPQPSCKERQDDCSETSSVYRAQKKYDRKRKGVNCELCQKPNKLICPRYVDDDCRASDLFSICADCTQCRVLPTNQKKHVVLYGTECKAIDYPFVQFTPNGHPYRYRTEGRNGIQITAKFLQINDLRPKSEEQKTVYNPFQPSCNYPRKKKSKRCK